MNDNNTYPAQTQKTDLLWPLCDNAGELVYGGSMLLGSEHADLTILSREQRVAYLLGCLIWQVRNGGWSWWVQNGYGVRLQETRDAALAVGGEHSAKVAAMLEELQHWVDLTAEDRGCNGSYFIMTAEQEELALEDVEVETGGERLCDVFDERYDDFDESWEREINSWLQARLPAVESKGQTASLAGTTTN